MINSELLKEAIADAKAVKVTAYANARASLQERFDKRFEAVFAEKLRNEAEEEDEATMQEVEAPNQVSGTGGEAKGPKTKAVTKGQPKKVSDANTNYKTVYMGGAVPGVPKADNTISETAEEEEEAKVSEQYEEEEEAKMDEGGFSSEDLDEIIKELEAEVAGEEEGQKVEEPSLPPSPENPGEEVPGEEPHTEPDGDEVPGEEESGEKPAPKFDDQTGEPLPGTDASAGEVPGEVPGGEPPVDVTAEPGSDVNVGPEAGEQPPVAPQMPPVPGREDQEEIGLEELLAALNEEADEEEEEEAKVDEGKLPPWLKKKGDKKEDEEEEDEGKMDEIANNGVPKNVSGQDKTGGTNTYPKAPQDASRNVVKGKNHNIQGSGNIGTGATGGKPMREVAKYQVALKEAYKTIEFLRGQINEVNLLNAKLLYTNKLFKEFATVIDEPYRMKIVEAFDLTKSVREVKLAYALLAESLNFGSKRVIQSRPTQKVDAAKRSIAKQITEGYASKPVASTRPVQVINESTNVMVARLQKLAGIKVPVANAKK